MNRLEKTILKNLIYNESFARKVLPFIKAEYFLDTTERIVFNEVFEFTNEFKVPPTHEALVINLAEKRGLSAQDASNTVELVNELHQHRNEEANEDWLIQQTEKFCQDKAIYNAIMESVHILDEKRGSKTRGEIPKLLSDALAVTFDNNIGHDYADDYEARYESYHRVQARVKFDLDLMNKITKGGLETKTLNIALAGTGVGKSLFMCHMAAACLSQGNNVLYITMEMAEEKIAERIDANLLNITMDELRVLSKSVYDTKFRTLKNKLQGKLIIKEFPTASASVLHFRALLNDLALKKNFKPDIIFVDYLNICASSRIKQGGSVNSYTYIKAIAEELRGLAVEYGVPIMSATQTTRTGYTNSDPDLTDTSESFGLPATADFMFALVTNEKLEALNQIMVKQLKNRYSDPASNKRFVLGIDRAKMKLYDVEASAQTDLSDTGNDDDEPPTNSFGNRGNKFNKNFGGLKV